LAGSDAVVHEVQGDKPDSVSETSSERPTSLTVPSPLNDSPYLTPVGTPTKTRPNLFGGSDIGSGPASFNSNDDDAQEGTPEEKKTTPRVSSMVDDLDPADTFALGPDCADRVSVSSAIGDGGPRSSARKSTRLDERFDEVGRQAHITQDQESVLRAVQCALDLDKVRMRCCILLLPISLA
jgi:hypothetical protein